LWSAVILYYLIHWLRVRRGRRILADIIERTAQTVMQIITIILTATITAITRIITGIILAGVIITSIPGGGIGTGGMMMEVEAVSFSRRK
jgi:hypothetical protein